MTTTGNAGHLAGLAQARGRRIESATEQLRTRSSAISSRALARRLVLGHVELAAAVEPLLLAKDVGGHRLPSAVL
jgi:hypothetical protein